MTTGRPLSRPGTITALAALCAVFGGVIYSEASGPVGDDGLPARVTASASERASLPETDGFSPPAAQTYGEITERPLFSPTRRPTPRHTAPDAIGAVSSFVFAGSVISRNERVALVQHGHPGKLVRLREGDLLEGWTVVSIEADRIIIEHGSEREELKPRDKTSPNALRPLPADAVSVGRRSDPS